MFLRIMISIHTPSTLDLIGYPIIVGLNPQAILKIKGLPHGKKPGYPVAPFGRLQEIVPEGTISTRLSEARDE